MNSTNISQKLMSLALDITRRRRIKKINGKLIVSQRRIARHLHRTVGTVQRFESKDFMNMSLGEFIQLLKLLEDNGIDTNI